MKIFITAVFFCAFLSGCFGHKPFQPPPYYSETWKKPNMSEDETITALLECGITTPTARIIGRDGETDMSDEEYALAILCMESDGFVSSSKERSWSGWCKRQYNPPDSCKEGTPPPKRDPKKRLDSVFCQELTTSRLCKP
jgi:hypothetical protein